MIREFIPTECSMALRLFLQGISQGPVYVYGDCGVGKSTAVCESLEEDGYFFISVPCESWSVSDMVGSILSVTGIALTKKALTEAHLMSRLRVASAINGIFTLVIDESQNLSPECTEFCDHLCSALSDIGYRIIYIGRNKPAGASEENVFHFMPLSFSDTCIIINTIAEDYGIVLPEPAEKIARILMPDAMSSMAIACLLPSLYEYLSQFNSDLLVPSVHRSKKVCTLPETIWSDSWILPYESRASLYRKIAFINGIDRLDHVAPKPEELLWENDSILGSVPVFTSTLRICPRCVRMGYHSVLHQCAVFDHCFMHPKCRLVETDIPVKDLEHKDTRHWEEVLAGREIIPQNRVITEIEKARKKITKYTTSFPFSLAVFDFYHCRNNASTVSTKNYINQVLTGKEECVGLVDGDSLLSLAHAYIADYRMALAYYMCFSRNWYDTVEEALSETYSDSDERILSILESAPEISLTVWAFSKIADYVPAALEKGADFIKDAAFSIDAFHNIIPVDSIPEELWPIYAAMLVCFNAQNYTYVRAALNLPLISRRYAGADKDTAIWDYGTYHNGVCMATCAFGTLTSRGLLYIFGSKHRLIQFWLLKRIMYYVCDMLFDSLLQAMRSGTVEELSRGMALPLPELPQFVFLGYNTKCIGLTAIYDDGREPISLI